MRFLVVEDDLITRSVLVRQLTPFGTCDSAVDGQEAVDAFEHAHREQSPYDLICLDIMMPRMSGMEALKVIRNSEKERGIHPRDEVKILMTTALDSPREVLDAFYQGGCTDYLVKPVTAEKLLIKLQACGLRV